MTAAREWIALVLSGVCLGLLVAWLEAKFQLDPRAVKIVLLVGAAILSLGCVLLMAAYVKELRREEDEWAGRSGDDEDAD